MSVPAPDLADGPAPAPEIPSPSPRPDAARSRDHRPEAARRGPAQTEDGAGQPGGPAARRPRSCHRGADLRGDRRSAQHPRGRPRRGRRPAGRPEPVPKELATKYLCLPWFVEGRDLYLIMADPTNLAAADAIAFASGLRVKPVVAPESEVAAALARFYSDEEASLAQFENIEVDIAGQLAVVSETEMEDAVEQDLEKAAQAIPLVKLVNGILTDAIRAGASDIHIEPQVKGVDLRYRVDGLLRQVMTMPKSVQQKVVSRIKIMSHMDISERRKPQDGRARHRSRAGSTTCASRPCPPPTARRSSSASWCRTGPRSRSRSWASSPTCWPRFKDLLQAAAGHDPGHRPDGQRQDVDALRRLEPPALRNHEHRHRRGPGRVPAAGRQPGGGLGPARA